MIDFFKKIIHNILKKGTQTTQPSAEIKPEPPESKEAPKMSVPKQCVDLVKKFEGLSLKPYLDSVKVPTIGYGTTYYEDGTKVTMKDPEITLERAEELLAVHLLSFFEAVKKLVKVPVNDNEISALTSFAYNVGTGNLQSSTLLKLLNAGEDRAKVSEQFLRWNKAGGVVLNGLTRRREAEKALFLS